MIGFFFGVIFDIYLTFFKPMTLAFYLERKRKKNCLKLEVFTDERPV